MRPAARFAAWMLAAALCIGAATAADSPADKALAAERESIQHADYRLSGQLVRIDAAGARTTYAVALKAHWFPGVLRLFLEVNSPAAARAHFLLEMRPDGHNTILVAHPGDKAPAPLPFDKWSEGPLGPGFSYEDLLDPQYFWPGQTLLPPAKYGARDCDVVRSTPGPADRSHYTSVQMWLDKTIGFPVYVEKSVKGTGSVKQFTYFGLRHNGGMWSASQIEEKTTGLPGSMLIVVDRGSAQAHLTAADFSPAQLIRFQDAK